MADCFFFFNDTATTEIYTLSLHDALPISARPAAARHPAPGPRRLPVARRPQNARGRPPLESGDRKSTRLNSSHGYISYAVFCLKKKKRDNPPNIPSHQTNHDATHSDHMSN